MQFSFTSLFNTASWIDCTGFASWWSTDQSRPQSARVRPTESMALPLSIIPSMLGHTSNTLEVEVSSHGVQEDGDSRINILEVEVSSHEVQEDGDSRVNSPTVQCTTRGSMASGASDIEDISVARPPGSKAPEVLWASMPSGN